MFVGREYELGYLEEIYRRKGLKTCMIYGRRRVGKTELISQFCRDKISLFFQFVLSTSEDQLSYIADVMSQSCGASCGPYGSLYEALKDIASYCKQQKTVVIFDEFPYLIDGDEDRASSEVQRFIDVLMHDADSMVIVCGSMVSVMRDQFTNPTRPLYGRFMEMMLLEPLGLRECGEFHPKMSREDNLKLYLTIGGLPAFQTLASGDTYAECIVDCFLRKHAPLQRETEMVLGMEIPQSSSYRKILMAVCDGAVSVKTIAEKVGIERRTCQNHVKYLEDMGFLERINPMYGASKRPIYRIKDDFVAFYYEVLEKNRAKLDVRRPEEAFNKMSGAISTFIGKRFEMVCECFIREKYYCLETGRWWGPSEAIGDDGRPEIVDIDVTAKVESDGALFDLFAECKFRNRLTGFTELNEP